MEHKVNNLTIRYSDDYGKWQVITPDGRVWEEFKLEKDAIDWAYLQKDFVYAE